MTRQQLAEKAQHIIDTHEYRMPPLLGVKNLSRSDYDTIVQWCTDENFRNTAYYLPSEVEAVLVKAGVARRCEHVATGCKGKLEAVA